MQLLRHSAVFLRQGSIAGQRHAFQLDKNHVFEAGRNKAVCGNTAAMLGENGCSWLSRHFEARLN